MLKEISEGIQGYVNLFESKLLKIKVDRGTKQRDTLSSNINNFQEA